jgi:anti-sigma regulatory factor (Ser/Thr protein kinase)
VEDVLSCRVGVDDGVLTVLVSGRLATSTSPVVHRVLLKHLLDRGRLLVDVSQLQVAWAPSAAAFPAVLAAAGGWPAARMVLFGASDETAALLRPTASTLGSQIAGDREQALALLDVRPARVRRTIELPALLSAAAFARSLVRTACAEWSVHALAERAEVVANELVSNAVQHCVGESVLVLTHDWRGLTIGVQDRSSRRPDPAAADDPGDARMGLRVVSRLSDAWGVVPHSRGKTIWASLRDG